MINTILGLVIAGIGGYSLYSYTGDLTPLVYLKFGGMSLIGGGFALYNLIPSLLSFKLPVLPNKTEVKVETVKELSPEIKIEDAQDMDTKCLFYLTERLKHDPESLDLLAKLNAKIFVLHHPAKS